MLDDRLSQAVASIVAAFTAHTRFFGLYEFEVVSAEFEKLSATPTDSKLGLPQLKDVPLMSPSSGARAKLDAGAKVLIAFVNGSPSRPVVLSTNANKPALEVTLECVTSLSIDAPSVEINASGSVKVNSPSVSLGSNALMGVARLGDTVQAGPFSGTITSASTSVKSA